MSVFMLVGIVGQLITAFFVRYAVMVIVEIPLDEKHCQKTAQQPHHDRLHAGGAHQGMRQHVQERDAQHHPRDKTDGHFHAPVRQVDQ